MESKPASEVPPPDGTRCPAPAVSAAVPVAAVVDEEELSRPGCRRMADPSRPAGLGLRFFFWK